ncbi:MAG: 23S rRNA (guanosine(2251)-2'-O)-methyltransferase RlmB [Oscillospiraceae bacterium]
MQDSVQNTPVYGKNAVEELLKSGAVVDTVLLAESMDKKLAGYFAALAKNAGAVVKNTRAEKLDALCEGGKHQGVAAFAAQVEYASLDDLLAAAARQGRPPFLLLADGVEDPHNLGALLRTALLCGAHGAVIPKRGAAGITPVVMKASAGAAARLPVARVANIGETVRRLKESNVFVYCADMQGPPAHSQNLTGGIALVMGAEGKGVSPLVKKLCDGTLSLPMAPVGTGVDSFNVSVAGGILMYEIFRQRGGA